VAVSIIFISLISIKSCLWAWFWKGSRNLPKFVWI